MLGSIVVGSFAGWVVFFGALLNQSGPFLPIWLGMAVGVLTTVIVAVWRGFTKEAQAKEA